ncbi:MAG TPA: TIGR03668 family PPOX class F420-dependent oxidoreductase [Candidatus Bathyarchaeia archaeon]|nr:TIGR03668 family PPOX class F420-dependent oxidoreductase [Candidatus Bathyarchaeia archaeon]
MSALPPDVAEFIASARVGRLATADGAGQPLVVPICYAWDGEALLSAIDGKPKRSGELARVRNIRENPKVSVVIDHYEEDWRRLRWVVFQGLAEILTAGRDFARGVDLLVSKYPQYGPMKLSRDSGTMIRVRPGKVLQWRYAS